MDATVRAGAWLAWLTLGLLLFVYFRDPLVLGWIGLVGVPWLAGALLLAAGDGRVLRDTAEAALRDRRAGLSAVALVAVLALCVPIFSVAAALFAATWMAALLLALAATGRARLLERLVTGGVAAVLGVGAVVLVLEGALRQPWLARSLEVPPANPAWEERYEGLWRENLFGFRSPYESVGKDPGTFRVLALGDSFTWGDRVADPDSTWPALLEASLERRWPDRVVQVVNMGQRGWTTRNEAELLRRLGWQLEPDLVLVQFNVNDALPSGPDFRRQGPKEALSWIGLLPVRFREGAVRNSVLLRFVEQRVNALAGYSARSAYSPFYRDGSEGWAQVREALRDIAEGARRHDVPVLLLVYPHLLPGPWTAETHPHRALHEKVVAAARAAGLRTLDLTPEFARAAGDGREWWATYYDAHPGGRANALVARELAARLGPSSSLTTAWREGSPAEVSLRPGRSPDPDTPSDRDALH